MREFFTRDLLTGVVFGAIAAVCLHRHFHALRGLSRAEKEDPERTDEVKSAVDEALDCISISHRWKDEQQITRRLRKSLRHRLDYEIEREPYTQFGRPDILVDGLVALEVKCELTNKADVDRAIGQCMRYHEEWPIMLVIFDTPRSAIRALVQRLKNEGIHYIEIVPFGDA